MDETDWLTDRFEESRSHLQAVAYRMLGSRTEAEDAVQDTWVRFSRSDTGDVENLGGWLTTVLARVCLNMLQARRSRREEPLVPSGPEIVSPEAEVDPEREALLADSVGPALLVVLESLAPAERLAFVLHHLFAVPFEEIAPIVGRSPAAARQLASRARRRVQGPADVPHADRARQREVVQAFLAASRDGDFTALLALLDPDVLRADPQAVPAGTPTELCGAAAVAQGARGASARARVGQLALVDGAAGIVVAARGKPRLVLAFTITNGKIVAIDVIADPTRLRTLDLAGVDD